MFYSTEEFESTVADIIGRFGVSREEALIAARDIELDAQAEYEAWLDRQQRDVEIFAEFG